MCTSLGAVQSISMCTNLKWLSVAGNGLTSLKGVETLSKLTVCSLSLSSKLFVFLDSSLVCRYFFLGAMLRTIRELEFLCLIHLALKAWVWWYSFEECSMLEVTYWVTSCRCYSLKLLLLFHKWWLSVARLFIISKFCWLSCVYWWMGEGAKCQPQCSYFCLWDFEPRRIAGTYSE